MKNTIFVLKRLNRRQLASLGCMMIILIAFSCIFVWGAVILSRFVNNTADYCLHPGTWVNIGGAHLYITEPTQINVGTQHFRAGSNLHRQPIAGCILKAGAFFIRWVVTMLYLRFMALPIAGIIYGPYATSIGLEEPVISNHGKNLATVARRLRSAPVEHLASFSAAGRKLDECTLLNATKVKPSHACFHWIRTLGETEYLIELHNHPFSSAAFSSGDFIAALGRNVSESIVIADSTVYIIKIPRSIKYPLDRDAIREAYNQTWKEVTAELKLRNSHSDDVVAISRETCRRIADRLGLIFEIESFWRWYWRTVNAQIAAYFYHTESGLKGYTLKADLY